MPDRLVLDFPLFPLPIVALPTESVPLHVFEDHYRRMIEQCLLTERSSESCGALRTSSSRWGARAKIKEVLERMDDGPLEHPCPRHPARSG